MQKVLHWELHLSNITLKKSGQQVQAMHHWSCLCLWRRSCWFSQYLFWKMSDTVTFMSTVSRNQWRIVKVPDSFKLYLLEMSKRCGVCLSGTWKLERRKGEVHGRKQEAKLLTESSHKQHQELRTIFLQQVYWATEVGTTWPHDVNIIVFIMIASGPKEKKKANNNSKQAECLDWI